jgi:hypothetical protein
MSTRKKAASVCDVLLLEMKKQEVNVVSLNKM